MSVRPRGRPRRAAAAALAAACLALVAAWPVQAARTLTWSSGADNLARGKADGMAITQRGRIFLAPGVAGLGGSQTPEGPVQIWAMAADREGNVYLGTGPEGQILKVDASGRPRLHFRVDEPMVTALAIAPDGALLAGTAPGGAIYRVDFDGEGAPWVATEERYVWSLAVGAEGQVYAGTGERGRILEMGPTGSVDVLFDSHESHIVTLLALPGGELLAGGAGQGLIYRVDGEGHALVLHDADLPEVVALTTDSAGGVLAALLAPPRPAARRPALRLRLPDGVSVGATDEAVGTLEESSGPILRGTIEGLAETDERDTEAIRGRVVRIDVEGGATELWRSTSEAPFCLSRDVRGRVLFGTGEPARLYRIEADDDVALLATLREAQLTGLLPTRRSVLISTSNPAAAYRLEDGGGESGVFESAVLDAGGPARWGTIRWREHGPGANAGHTEIYTRTGNSRQPDETWSAWSAALINAAGSAVVNPDARFLQWRVRQVGSPEVVPWLDTVSVSYEPYNRRPTLVDFRVDRADPAHPGVRTFRWTAGDPDDDPVEAVLEYRPAGAAGWAVAVVAPPTGPGEGRLEWATAELGEGAYEVRVLANDRAANPSGEGLASAAPAPLHVVVDRSPPTIEFVSVDDGTVRVRLEDALSDIRALELLAGGRVRARVRSEDGVCDSSRESFRVEPPGDFGGPWSLRGIDAAGNVVEASLAPGTGVP